MYRASLVKPLFEEAKALGVTLKSVSSGGIWQIWQNGKLLGEGFTPAGLLDAYKRKLNANR